MKQSRPALRYAKAILNIAKDHSSEAEVNDNMKVIAATIDESKDLATMLASPVIKASDKKKVLDALFSENSNSVIAGLFNLLEENKRLSMLQSIAKQYTVIFEHFRSTQVAKVTTAVALTPEMEAKVHAKIEELTGNKSSLENTIDPNILGGFILRVGDVQYDASISNHLNELRKEFDNSHYIPKI
ncbi:MULTISPECIES: ATP synthase F1 subunit delta [Tenacibaculum]|uniref:ATP synthase F1 subunit delta n=1 Tax=Tenacibaculum TaxID=104267 RepID=UPI001F0AC5A6|nr:MULTISPECIES: ATP synthase F1 subunit delta [Tenacibaculum]MCH3881467.1 ATP synthase F1 subunit delta [Tenacibaculum aquimarinum]MCH3883636.1 ATP synthase F1 subunit delta [Tenacibaculum aquimarinum]MDO6598939.1 ATP synthase F1 subunit delta [Tenacibaculum sp. 1_MG-2023]